jgi:hypothetical protein
MVFEDCASIAFQKAVIELNVVFHHPIDIAIVQDVGMSLVRCEVQFLNDLDEEYLDVVGLSLRNERLLENGQFVEQVLLEFLAFLPLKYHQQFAVERWIIRLVDLKQQSLDWLTSFVRSQLAQALPQSNRFFH